MTNHTVCGFICKTDFSASKTSVLMCACSLDLNAAESGVQHKPATPRSPISNDQPPSKEGCAC